MGDIMYKNVFLEIDLNNEDLLICNTCNQTKPVSQFYKESSKRRKTVYQKRRQCIECWSKYKGKMKTTLPGAKLFYYEDI